MKTDVIINREALYALRELPSESGNCAGYSKTTGRFG